jgi:hypothetical protein
MSEHKHEWQMRYHTFKDGWPRAVCVAEPYDCHTVLEEDEVNRRLNAVEHFSAEDAKSIHANDDACQRPELLVYASILDGEDV